MVLIPIPVKDFGIEVFDSKLFNAGSSRIISQRPVQRRPQRAMGTMAGWGR
jgi:hypothetical protein